MCSLENQLEACCALLGGCLPIRHPTSSHLLGLLPLGLPAVRWQGRGCWLLHCCFMATWGSRTPGQDSWLLFILAFTPVFDFSKTLREKAMQFRQTSLRNLKMRDYPIGVKFQPFIHWQEINLDPSSFTLSFLNGSLLSAWNLLFAGSLLDSLWYPKLPCMCLQCVGLHL